MPDGLILTESQLAAPEKAKADEAAHASSTARAAKMMGMLRRTRTRSATAGRRLHHQPGLSLRPRPCSRGRGASVNDRAIGSILALQNAAAVVRAGNETSLAVTRLTVGKAGRLAKDLDAARVRPTHDPVVEMSLTSRQRISANHTGPSSQRKPSANPLQRRIRHTDRAISAGSASGNVNVLIPGYYMLFVFNQAGVPSVAKIVHVG